MLGLSDFLKRWGVPFFSALLFCTLVSCSNTAKKRDEAVLHMRIGTSFLAQGNQPSALRELLIAEQLDPKNEAIQNNLGLAYFIREKYELAAQHLQKALELKPSYSEARNNYGRTLIELGRYEDAAREIQAVINDLTYEDPAKAWVNLGLVYFRKGDYRTAKDKFTEAIRINRDHCLAQTLYGRSLLELGQFSAAAPALDNAVVICRPAKFDEPFYFSGLSYYKLGRTSSAIARMEEVIKLYPGGRYAKKAESRLKLMK
jgi:type IV pilus biogenesis/stability protein PilW